LSTSVGTTTTYFIGAHYEVTGSGITKYYFAGTQRIAIPQGDDVRKDGTLYYLLGDHLGSTSIVTDAAGNAISQTKYKPWGEVRYSSGTSPTDYTYTGQYSHTSDFGLMFFNARWLDVYHVWGYIAQSTVLTQSTVLSGNSYRQNAAQFEGAVGNNWHEFKDFWDGMGGASRQDFLLGKVGLVIGSQISNGTISPYDLGNALRANLGDETVVDTGFVWQYWMLPDAQP